MIRRKRLRLSPSTEQVESMECLLMCEMLLHDILLMNAVEIWKRERKLPSMREWMGFIGKLREGNEFYRKADLASLRGTAVTLYVRLKEKVMDPEGEKTPEEILESFPEFYREEDFDFMPIRIYSPERIEFSEGFITVPGAGDIPAVEGDARGGRIKRARFTFRDYSWWLEWDEFHKRKTRARVWVKDGVREDGSQIFRWITLKGRKKEEGSEEEPPRGMSYFLSECE